MHKCGENPINPRHRLTHDKLRLRHNFLIITSQGAHVRLHAEVFGVSLPSAVRPSDEYMTSHGYDGIHVMIKHYDDGVLTSQLKQLKVGDDESLEMSFEGEGCFDVEKLEKVKSLTKNYFNLNQFCKNYLIRQT